MRKFNSKQLILTLLKHSGLKYCLQLKKRLCTFFCSPSIIKTQIIHVVLNRIIRTALKIRPVTFISTGLIIGT